MARALRLAHVVLQVRDLERSERFYREHLGLEVTERNDKMVFLHSGREHHSLALFRVAGEAPADRRERAGLHHVSFEVASAEEVDAEAERLREAGVPIVSGPGTHEEDDTRYLYFEDPDGHWVEIVGPARTGGAARAEGP